MARKHHKFQTPPPEDPIAAARDSSLAFRLNSGFSSGSWAFSW